MACNIAVWCSVTLFTPGQNVVTVSVTQASVVLKQMSAPKQVFFFFFILSLLVSVILTGVIEGHFLLDYTAALFHLSVQLWLTPPQLLLTAETEQTGDKAIWIMHIHRVTATICKNVYQRSRSKTCQLNISMQLLCMTANNNLDPQNDGCRCFVHIFTSNMYMDCTVTLY